MRDTIIEHCALRLGVRAAKYDLGTAHCCPAASYRWRHCYAAITMVTSSRIQWIKAAAIDWILSTLSAIDLRTYFPADSRPSKPRVSAQ